MINNQHKLIKRKSRKRRLKMWMILWRAKMKSRQRKLSIIWENFWGILRKRASLTRISWKIEKKWNTCSKILSNSIWPNLHSIGANESQILNQIVPLKSHRIWTWRQNRPPTSEMLKEESILRQPLTKQEFLVSLSLRVLVLEKLTLKIHKKIVSSEVQFSTKAKNNARNLLELHTLPIK